MEEKIQTMSNPVCPKTKNRWLVRFPSEFDIKEYTLSRVTKPKYENGRWNDIRIVFRNTTPDSPEKGLVKMIGNPKILIIIEDLDPTGVVIGKWEVKVKEIVSIDFGGELSYDNDDMQEIELIVKPLLCMPVI